MNVLHIAAMKNTKSSGVSVVVPQHIENQSNYANVGLLNISDKVNFLGINTFDYDKESNVDSLPVPFNKPDLVVFHQVFYTEFLKIAKKLRKKNIPYIIVPHGCLSQDALKIKPLKKFIGIIFLFKKFIVDARAIQCLSSDELQSIAFNVHKFVSTNGFNLPNKVKNKFNRDKIQICYIGRLEMYHKGLDLLLESLKNNKNELESKKVIISLFGPSDNHQEINKLIKELKIDGFVSVNNGVYGDEKEKILLSSDIFIQTSRFEGMPMGLLEALSYGIPCFISMGTTLGNLVRDYNAGWVCKNNVNDISLNIKKMISEIDTLSEKSLNARNLVKNEFNWNKIAKNAIKEYERLIYFE